MGGNYSMALIGLFCLLGIHSGPLQAQECPGLANDQQELLLEQHLGPFDPGGEAIVHRAYVFNFNPDKLVPNWVAWHIEPGYRDTPDRKGKWSRFRPDPSVPKPVRVVAKDYTNSGYHRGHLAPFFISGGDRDGDGMDAEYEDRDGLPIEDIDDACTVFEINYMTNMSPQLPHFNSQGGAWYDLETKTREKVDSGASYQIIAGNLFLSNQEKTIGARELRISVPDALYKIIHDGEQARAYLFFQESRLGYEFGCLPKADLDECRVSLEQLRTIPGVEF